MATAQTNSDESVSENDTVDLSIDDSDEWDSEAQRQVREYAESVAPGQWEFISASEDQIWFGSSDYRNLYKLVKRGRAQCWIGKRGNYDVRPQETDLQSALDVAGEYMKDHPIEDTDGDDSGCAEN